MIRWTCLRVSAFSIPIGARSAYGVSIVLGPPGYTAIPAIGQRLLARARRLLGLNALLPRSSADQGLLCDWVSHSPLDIAHQKLAVRPGHHEVERSGDLGDDGG